ncbi:MAG: RagB/SusD family nutrient uptake outer membrane protein [Alistipes sp.]|nr:RagB/SusD family nutrient uptake outer membrane protein [Alistipes sp.]
MKNILKYSFVLVFLSSVCTTSCIETFEPVGAAITRDQATSSDKSLEAMTGAISQYLANSNWASSTHTAYGYASLCFLREVWGNDMAVTESIYDNYQLEAQNQSGSATQLHPQIVWLMYTKALSLANEIIRMYPDVDALTEAQSGYVGAAYAFRALVWLEMAQLYEFKPNKYTSKPSVEGYTIPYLHENITEDSARFNPRLKKAEILEHIYESLDVAIELLPGFESTTKTLPTLPVAYGILARAKMYEGNYDEAEDAAYAALREGAYSELTEAQWTDIRTGFNNADSQQSWMLCTRLSSESSLIKLSPIINFSSWMCSETTFGYGGCVGAGAVRLCDADLYSKIADTDFRKKSWKPTSDVSITVPYIPASGTSQTDYPGPSYLPELANVKFRPGGANPNDYITGAATDFPMMRMEEMKFIIAECECRRGETTTLREIVKTRNPQYSVNLSGDQLLYEMFLQKRIEFWGEGVMFWDYKRCPEILSIKRGYKGTNHFEGARLNCDGLAPWFNLCINGYEADENKALSETNNPDPSNTVETWKE